MLRSCYDIRTMSALDAIRAERMEKLARMREAGMDPYPTDTRRTHTNEQFLAEHAALEASGAGAAIAGRIMSLREHGGSLFLDLFDGSGEVQAYIKKDDFGAEAFDRFTAFADAGDIIEISGTAFTTKRGMRSILASGWRMLAKALLPLPSEWYGIKDEDERYRKRYLDILLTKDLAGRVKRRSVFWNSMRAFLLAEGYVEVETPVLETVTGGADARPFITHHNALDIETYLRISAGELWQKKLLVAGLPKVFEIGRIFRNEGMSAEHLQDYTQMESYEAFMDYEQGMEMIQKLYRHVAQAVYGTTKFTIRGFDVDLAEPWERYDYSTLVKKHFNIDPLATNVGEIEAALKKHDIAYDAPTLNIERGVDLLWKQVRKTLGGPGFLIGVPVYLESLAKRSPKDPRVVERFQVILGGSENGKGFSELNDPVDQAERFRHQQALRDGGDEEAQMNDASFVEALEYGMPPAFGFGVSERLFSFLEGVPVREAQIFPLMRPRE
ncbi:MAG: lysine--tRNA ligase [bacterium]